MQSKYKTVESDAKQEREQLKLLGPRRADFALAPASILMPYVQHNTMPSNNGITVELLLIVNVVITLQLSTCGLQTYVPKSYSNNPDLAAHDRNYT